MRGPTPAANATCPPPPSLAYSSPTHGLSLDDGGDGGGGMRWAPSSWRFPLAAAVDSGTGEAAAAADGAPATLLAWGDDDGAAGGALGHLGRWDADGLTLARWKCVCFLLLHTFTIDEVEPSEIDTPDMAQQLSNVCVNCHNSARKTSSALSIISLQPKQYVRLIPF